MSQSLSQVLVHVVFSTRERKRFLGGAVAGEVHSYLAGACRALGSEAYRVGGVEDHVHIACTLPRTLSVSELVRDIKSASSKWIKSRYETLQGFAWQGGYAAFSFSRSQLDEVVRYIENQEEHHRRVSFQDEVRAFLRRYEVDYDERYLWE